MSNKCQHGVVIAAKLDEKTMLKIRKNAMGAFIITKTSTSTKQEMA